MAAPPLFTRRREAQNEFRIFQLLSILTVVKFIFKQTADFPAFDFKYSVVKKGKTQ